MAGPWSIVGVAVGLAIGVAGCGSKLPHPPYATQPSSALVEVEYPPPPAHVETVPPRPTEESRAVWLDGEWTWRNGKWSWKVGRWVVPPEGASYSPWTTARGVTGITYYAPGTWRDVHGATVADPKALAVAGASSGAVFDADGEVERTGTARGGRGGKAKDGGT